MRPPLRHFALLAGLVFGVAMAQAGELAIIIDDIGYSAPLGERSLHLPGAFTYAVLPHAPQGPRLARLGASLGKEIMLHNPMSNIRKLPLDAGALSGTMGYTDFLHTLEENLNAIPEARGLNNHMGSQLTQETEPMGWLMQHLGDRGYYFIDSRTTAASQAWETAQRYRVPSLKRDVFLDHERDPEQIARQLEQAIELARTRGYAIAIGHPHPETLTVLEQIEPALAAAGVTLVPISRLLERPQSLAKLSRKSQSCLAPPPTLWRPPIPERPLLWKEPLASLIAFKAPSERQTQHLLLNEDCTIKTQWCEQRLSQGGSKKPASRYDQGNHPRTGSGQEDHNE